MTTQRLTLSIIAGWLMLTALPSAAQDHEHEQMQQAMEAEPQSTPTSEQGLRDPHAYANGYERTSGPYALASQPQIKLADEQTFIGLWMDRFEYVNHDVTEGAEMEGYAWLGNSYRQWLLQAQIETVENEVEAGEIDLLYSVAASPFWDFRFGLHHAFGEKAHNEWAAFGFKGLAPYWLEVDATLHLGKDGHVAFDLETEYELLLTQHLVLQPRLDISAFSESDPDLGRGSGLSAIKVGARLRYELDRQFAPYLGVERVTRYGETVDLLPAGTARSETHVVAGLRFWF